jgi:hypothetical protein
MGLITVNAQANRERLVSAPSRLEQIQTLIGAPPNSTPPTSPLVRVGFGSRAAVYTYVRGSGKANDPTLSILISSSEGYKMSALAPGEQQIVDLPDIEILPFVSVLQHVYSNAGRRYKKTQAYMLTELP